MSDSPILLDTATYNGNQYKLFEVPPNVRDPIEPIFKICLEGQSGKDTVLKERPRYYSETDDQIKHWFQSFSKNHSEQAG